MSPASSVQSGRPAAPAPGPARSSLRGEVEAAITASLDVAHRLIVLLDALDGDPDLEGEEPEAGAREWCGEGAQRFDVGAAA